MRIKACLLPLAALCGAAHLLGPEPANAFIKRGDSLNTNQRDFRMLNNFANPGANDNTDPEPQFPGAQGAVLAIWKGAAEWGSLPHGNGRGDPTQDRLGDGGANFDYAYAGLATGVGATNNNIVSVLSSCGSGVLAFTETPTTDGWRIRFCRTNGGASGVPWSDGPGGILSNQFDIQATAAHMFGIALGLSNSPVGDATVSALGVMGSVSKRSLHPDDIAGVQCIYGVASPTKPVIDDILHGVGTLTILGSNFAATGNSVWFTSATPTPTGGDPIVRAIGVPSTNGGTEITVTIPAAAGPGDVLVQIPGGLTGDTLSNAFPSPLEPCFVNRVLPAQRRFTDPALTDTGGDPLVGPKIGDTTEPFNLQLDCSGVGSPGVYSIVLRLGFSTSPAATGLGFLYCSGPKVLKCNGAHVQNTVECAPGGIVLPNDPSFVDLVYCQQAFCSAPGGGRLSNAIITTIGR